VSFWTAIVVIVALGMLSEMYRARLKKGSEKSEKLFDEIAGRMARIEERMTDLETIVLEKERARPYRELEREGRKAQ
jgi:hypothetical protein